MARLSGDEFVVLLFSAVLHEVSHGYEAERLGDDTARRAGRLTLNPLAHLDPFMSFLMPLVLFFTTGFFFAGAKPVPYNPNNLKDPRTGSVKVALAGLLHDIGYKEIDPAILDKPRAALTSEETKILESHPMRGAKILSSIPAIPDEILQIVMQHHERERGLGYPLGLERSRIHPIAKIIAVADEFCDLAIQGRGRPALRPLEAFRRMETLHGGTLDPACLAALKKIVMSGNRAMPSQEIAAA